VEPAGGETGVPHCLAEVRKPLRGFILIELGRKKNANFSPKICQTKNEKKLKFSGEGYYFNLCFSNIQAVTAKCKSKMVFF
jgi:hypothetical protein